MPSKFAELAEPQVFESGVFKSVDALKAPLWVDGKGCTFKKGQVEKAKGYSAWQTAAAAVNSIAQALVSNVRRLYFGTATALYYFPDGGSITAIRTGLSSGRWSLLPWGAFLIATNDVDALQLWQNTGTAANISDGPTRARIVKALNVFIVAFDADGIAGRFEWCDRGNPAVWTPSLSNLAGGDNIRNIASRTQCAEAFGNGIAVWSSEQMYLISYVAGTAVLAYRTLDADVGAAGLNAVAVRGTIAYGLERRGFWKTDGLNVEWIAQPAMWDYFKDRIDFSLGDEITCHYDADADAVEWHWPIVGGGYEGWAYGLQNRAWMPREWKLTAAVEGAVWGKALGAVDTALVQLADTVNLAGGAMTSYIQTKPLAWGDTDVYKWIDELRLRKTGTGATLQIGLLDEPDGSPTWLDAETLAERHFPMREAAFWIMKIGSTGVDGNWSFAGVEAYGYAGGSRL